MSPPLRAMVASVEFPGHAFPAIALARELDARGHDVLVHAPQRWRDAIEGLGLRFAVAQEHTFLPAVPRAGGRRPSVTEAARAILPLIQDLRLDVVVSDTFALAPALAAELAGVPRATLIPIPFPVSPPGLPPHQLGLLPPRTLLGAGMWRLMDPVMRMRPSTRWLRGSSARLNAVREQLGLPPLERSDGAITEGLIMVATLPQLEYPRSWPADVHVTGPMIFDPPHPEVELPDGEEPLVLVATSTERDAELRLLGIALEALEEEPVRVVAAAGRRGERWSGRVPDKAVVADWVSYAQLMPRAALVVGQGGHGTLARALTEGLPVLVCPDAPDMAENGARVVRAGAGLMLPKPLLGKGPLRWAVRRLLAEGRFAARARAIAAWGRRNPGPARGAELVERYAARHVTSGR